LNDSLEGWERKKKFLNNFRLSSSLFAPAQCCLNILFDTFVVFVTF
jgi:hypothetical protein